MVNNLYLIWLKINEITIQYLHYTEVIITITVLYINIQFNIQIEIPSIVVNHHQK